MALHWNLDELGYKFCTPHPTLFLFGSCFELFLHISHLCCHWPSFSYKNVWNNLSGDIRKQLVWRANTYVCSAHALIIRRSIETSVQHKFTKYVTEGPYTLCNFGLSGTMFDYIVSETWSNLCLSIDNGSPRPPPWDTFPDGQFGALMTQDTE